MESKDRHADDIRKDVELSGIEADKILADQVELDIRIKVGEEARCFSRRGQGAGGQEHGIQGQLS